jgi:phage tail sheath protein FI
VTSYQAPGVYREDVFPPPPAALLTGVPVFLGYAASGVVGQPLPLTMWPRFQQVLGPPLADGYLGAAVRGFFENGGSLCYVVRLEDAGDPPTELTDGLEAAWDLDDADLVCAPDIMRQRKGEPEPEPAVVVASQAAVLADCQTTGGRFAVLDAVQRVKPDDVQDQGDALTSDDGALYHPWLWVPDPAGQPRYVPPCGHVAGAYAGSDQRVGVHKPPANEPLEGVLDLRVDLDPAAVGTLYEHGVNCLRALPGRGIRVWGARTLSDDPAWSSVGARRVLLTVGRWLERFMTGVVFEPNDVRLWVRVLRELTAYLEDLFERGALDGRTPEEAFYVKCDGETNPREVLDAGRVVAEVGLALAAPAEFVVVRVIAGASGVSARPVP